MGSSTPECKKCQADGLNDRIKALLDNMPEMIVLISHEFVIEYMNPSAVAVFGNLTSQACREHLCNTGKRCRSNCPVQRTSRNIDKALLQETLINNIHVEYTAVSFEGYPGKKLVMLTMRDITQRIVNELKIVDFHENLNAVLQEKIMELHGTEEIQEKLLREIAVLKKRLQLRKDNDGMIGSSRKMSELREMVYQIAESDSTILISGEPGTDKELVANLLYKYSRRNGKPFLKINCGSKKDKLLECDLFGYEKGTFPGIDLPQIGKFEIAGGGTVFLDGIGSIRPKMQAALLHMLQNGEITRMGGSRAIPVDVRIIAATDVDLAQAVKYGDFRLDLFYRLNVINITIPPLRERKEDIIEIASFFFNHYRRAYKKDIDFMPDCVIDKLLEHDWPGNVRELENVIRQAVLAAKSSSITEQDICFDTAADAAKNDYLNRACEQLGRKSLKAITADFEKKIINRCLLKNEANVLQTADDLQIGKTALYTKIKMYGIEQKKYNNPD